MPGRIWEGYLPSSPWPRTSNAFAHLSLTPCLIGLFLALTYGLSVGPFGPPTPNGSVDCQPDLDRIRPNFLTGGSRDTVRLSSAALRLLSSPPPSHGLTGPNLSVVPCQWGNPCDRRGRSFRVRFLVVKDPWGCVSRGESSPAATRSINPTNTQFYRSGAIKQQKTGPTPTIFRLFQMG